MGASGAGWAGGAGASETAGVSVTSVTCSAGACSAGACSAGACSAGGACEPGAVISGAGRALAAGSAASSSREISLTFPVSSSDRRRALSGSDCGSAGAVEDAAAGSVGGASRGGAVAAVVVVVEPETCSTARFLILSATSSTWPIPAKTARSACAGTSLIRSLTCGKGICDRSPSGLFPCALRGRGAPAGPGSVSLRGCAGAWRPLSSPAMVPQNRAGRQSDQKGQVIRRSGARVRCQNRARTGSTTMGTCP